MNKLDQAIESMANSTVYYLLPKEYLFGLLLIAGIIIIGMLGAFPLTTEQSKDNRNKIVAVHIRRVTLSVIFVVTLALFTLYKLSGLKPQLDLKDATIAFVASWLLGKLSSLFVNRLMATRLSNAWNTWRMKLNSDVPSDIRSEDGKIKALTRNVAPDYWPELDKFLVGYEEDKDKPVYVDFEEWKINNEAVIGPTQTGKGVLIGVEVDQAIRKGCFVAMVDPKPDKHIYAIMKKACIESGRELIEIDLCGEWNTQGYDLLVAGTDSEKYNRLLNMCDLHSQGNTADFYKNIEREALRGVMDDVGTSNLKGIIEALDILNRVSKKAPATTAYTRLSEYCRLRSVTAKGKGVNITKAVKDNAVIYIRSSTTDKLVTALTKALLDELTIAIKNTSSATAGGDRMHHCFVVIDELKFLITELIADMLATVTGFDAHMLLAYQSIADIRSVADKSLDKDAIETSVTVNTRRQLYYTAKDTETAQFVSEASGTVRKKIPDREQIELNSAGAEVRTGEKTLSTVEEPYIHANVVRTLDPRVAVVIQVGKVATIIRTCWVEIDWEKYQLKAYKPGQKKPNSIMEMIKREKPNETIGSLTGTNRKPSRQPSNKPKGVQNKAATANDEKIEVLKDQIANTGKANMTAKQEASHRKGRPKGPSFKTTQ